MTLIAADNTSLEVDDPVRLQSAVANEPPEHAIDRLLLNGTGITAEVRGAVTDGTYELTIEGASNVSIDIEDTGRKLAKTDLFIKEMMLSLDGRDFEKVASGKNGDIFTLTFEDFIVSAMRKYDKPRKADRASVTRAEFGLLLAREVKERRIRYFSPELHKKQPIGKVIVAGTQRDTQDEDPEPGFKAGARLTVKGDGASEDQKNIAATCMSVAVKQNAPRRAAIAMIATIIVESTMRQARGGGDDAISWGAFQDTCGGTGPPGRRTDLAKTAYRFLTGDDPCGAFHVGAINLANKHKDWSIGQIAQAVQISRFPERYDQVAREAERWVDAYNGSSRLTDDGGTTTTTTVKKYEFTRGQPGGPKGEDTWDCLGRLAEEVQWRRFTVGSTLYFVSEIYLFGTKPRMRISEESKGVDNIDYSIDTSKKTVDEITITASARRWSAPPGTVVEVFDCGNADGRWLVTNISGKLFGAEVTITAKKPMKPKPEPAPETETTTTSSGDTTSTGSGAAPLSGSVRDKIAQAAKSQIGVQEGTEAWRKIMRPVGGYDPWCGFFASWCWKQAGVDAPVFGAAAGAMDWGRSRGLFHRMPQVGDTVHYGRQHVGVVIEVKGSIIVTVDGNYSQAATRREYNWHSNPGPAAIAGFTSPPGA